MIWRMHWLGRAAAGTLAALLAALAAAGCGSAGHPAAASSNGPASPAALIAGVTVRPEPKLHAMLPASVTSAGVIRVATNIPYPPWEMYTTAGGNQPTGVDYDLSAALAARLGVRASFDQTPFDSIVPAILAGKENVVMAGMWDTKQREGALEFVDYATDGYGLLVPGGNPQHISSPASLSGKTVAVQSGTTQVTVLQALNTQLQAAGKKPVTILQFGQDSDTLLALQSGKANAQFDGLSVAAYTAKTFGGGHTFQLVDNASLARTFGAGIVGIGVPKNDPELANALRQALQSLISSGVYTKILDQYGLGRLALASAEVDAGGR
jgi:polar amino acid transport system substrate-binding protein